MEEMFNLIVVIETMMNKFIPDTVFINETIKLFEAILIESNSLLKHDVILLILIINYLKSLAGQVNFSDYVWSIMEKFSFNTTKAILTDQNLSVES